LLTACWALLAVAVATDSNSVRNATVIAIVIILAAVVGRTLRSRNRRAVLLGWAIADRGWEPTSHQQLALRTICS